MHAVLGAMGHIDGVGWRGGAKDTGKYPLFQSMAMAWGKLRNKQLLPLLDGVFG